MNFKNYQKQKLKDILNDVCAGRSNSHCSKKAWHHNQTFYKAHNPSSITGNRLDNTLLQSKKTEQT